ncbi:MAG: hypothetical protein ACRER2_07765 [Methylococcales bacterium]
MKHDPFNRLFCRELPDESVDLLFAFLQQLTDLCFEAYQEQIVRMATDTHDLHEPPDLHDCDLDDEIPF